MRQLGPRAVRRPTSFAIRSSRSRCSSRDYDRAEDLVHIDRWTTSSSLPGHYVVEVGAGPEARPLFVVREAH